MLSLTIIAFFAKILQNLYKSLFFLKIYIFFPRNSFFSSTFRIWVCSKVLGLYVVEMLVTDLNATWCLQFPHCIFHHMLHSRSLGTSLRLLHLPCFTQHMPPRETWSLRGTVFHLHPETSFDIRSLPFHMPQTLLY